MDSASPSSGAVAAKLVSTAAESEAKSERKLIYSAKVSIETSDFDRFAADLATQVESLDGFLANYSDQRSSGDRRSGTWAVRVPSAQFQTLLAWLDVNALVRTKRVQSQDVSEEYVDLSARLANKKNTEARLIKILEERPGKLEDVLTVEKELDRVREEVERIEGRLRFLSEKVALSTVEITVNTRIEYEAKVISLGQRIEERWTGAMRDVRQTMESLLLWVVGIAPWLPFLAAFFFVAYWGYRKLRLRLR